MTITSRDAVFIAINAVIAVLIGFAVRAGLLAQDGAATPMLLIFVGMAAVEFVMGYLAQAPFGQLIAMPIRFGALAIAFGAYLLVVSL